MTNDDERNVETTDTDILPMEPDAPDSPGEGRSGHSTVCEFISGIAGTGKTYTVRERIERDPSWGLLAATTGIAAVNLGTTTINSLLKYYDTESLRDSYLTGRLSRAMHDIAIAYRRLVIDEVSMMDKLQLDLLYRAACDANDYADVPEPFGLTLVGDFAQLPPVNADFAFRADCWPLFRAGTTRLTKVWRQEQQEFLSALNRARCGDGDGASHILSSVGVQWHTALDTTFDGTTLVAKNDEVARYNAVSLMRVHQPAWFVPSRRWGRESAEWRNIPSRLELKDGAYVMLLANQSDGEGGFSFVNGDCGHVVSRDGDRPDSPILVELVRDGGRVVEVTPIVRSVSSKDKPLGWPDSAMSRVEGYYPHRHRSMKGRYVDGQVEYYPLRLAYASTVHKSQGLSLDRVQMDLRAGFFSAYSMVYVALSRCRTLEGLRIVGQRERLVKACKADPRVVEFL